MKVTFVGVLAIVAGAILVLLALNGLLNAGKQAPGTGNTDVQ